AGRSCGGYGGRTRSHLDPEGRLEVDQGHGGQGRGQRGNPGLGHVAGPRPAVQVQRGQVREGAEEDRVVTASQARLEGRAGGDGAVERHAVNAGPARVGDGRADRGRRAGEGEGVGAVAEVDRQ